MKFSKNTSLFLLGLAGSAAADWRDASVSTPVDPTSTETPKPWGPPKSPVDGASVPWSHPPSLETVTVYDSDVEVIVQSTIYRTTIIYGGSTCAAPTGAIPDSGSGHAGSGSVSPAEGSGSGNNGGSWVPGSGSGAGSDSGSGSGNTGGSWVPGSGSGAGSDSGSGSSNTGGSWVPGSGSGSGSGNGASPVDGSTTAGPGGYGHGGHLNPGIPGGSIAGTDGQVFTWTGVAPTKPAATQAAPTYAGWGDNNGGDGSGTNGTGPSPGTDASNVTKPYLPLKDGWCNSASDRSKWCGGFDINTDYYKNDPNTGKICAYDWVITNTTLDLDGTPRLALAINGQVPGPLIECNWGDTIQVSVTNKMRDNATSIHWHGIIQKGTNDQDGVPGITECAIAPGDTRVYTFKASSYGTGWYHSHALAQLGDGIRGPMIIHGPATANYDVDMGTVMIDDLFGNGTNTVPAGTQNSRIAHFGPGPTWNYVLNGHNTFPDLSRGKHALWRVKPGKKHLFRIINSASQNFWSVHFDNHKMTVIAADYVPIEPYTTEWLNIGLGQRYDVIVEMDQPKAGYFLRAVTQTGCPSACANTGLGNANGIIQYEGAPLTLPTSTYGNKTVGDFAACRDEPLTSLVPYLKKAAGTSSAFSASVSTLPAGNVARVSTADDGFVFRWFFNNAAIKVDYTNPTLQAIADGNVNNNSISNPIILEKQGEWYYFVIQNQFFASHPMHLHGHDMSVLGSGNVPWNPALVTTLNFGNPTRRDTTILVGSPGPGSPPGYTVIGFQADNPGAWLMHCHIVWHVDGGLALQWIERPKDIPAKQYTSKSTFQNECKNVKSYFANGGQALTSGESGLKARTYFDDLINARDETVVRRGESARRRYIDQHLKRGHHF